MASTIWRMASLSPALIIAVPEIYGRVTGVEEHLEWTDI